MTDRDAGTGPQQQQIVRDKIAFEQDHEGYKFVATYLSEPEQDALIEISKDGVMVRSFLFPAYKIWNIAVHAEDIVAGLNENKDDGLYEAGSFGLFGGDHQGAHPVEQGDGHPGETGVGDLSLMIEKWRDLAASAQKQAYLQRQLVNPISMGYFEGQSSTLLWCVEELSAFLKPA